MTQQTLTEGSLFRTWGKIYLDVSNLIPTVLLFEKCKRENLKSSENIAGLKNLGLFFNLICENVWRIESSYLCPNHRFIDALVACVGGASAVVPEIAFYHMKQSHLSSCKSWSHPGIFIEYCSYKAFLFITDSWTFIFTHVRMATAGLVIFLPWKKARAH